MGDYNINISKGQCKITKNIFYIANYSPNFPDEAGDEISSFKTGRFESLIEKISEQVIIAEKREDNLGIHLDDKDFSVEENYRFFEVVSK